MLERIETLKRYPGGDVLIVADNKIVKAVESVEGWGVIPLHLTGEETVKEMAVLMTRQNIYRFPSNTSTDYRAAAELGELIPWLKIIRPPARWKHREDLSNGKLNGASLWLHCEKSMSYTPQTAYKIAADYQRIEERLKKDHEA